MSKRRVYDRHALQVEELTVSDGTVYSEAHWCYTCELGTCEKIEEYNKMRAAMLENDIDIEVWP